jgi:hypothetical protein
MYLDLANPVPDNIRLEEGNPQPSSPFFQATVTQAAFVPETNGNPQVGVTLTQNEYIDWDEGGRGAPVDSLGWSTGLLSWAQKWAAWSGQILIPNSTLSMLTSQQYGDVGRDTRNQVLVAQYNQQYQTFLPSEQTLAYESISPGFQDVQ